jgi:hypothetical protein
VNRFSKWTRNLKAPEKEGHVTLNSDLQITTEVKAKLASDVAPSSLANIEVNRDFRFGLLARAHRTLLLPSPQTKSIT